MSVRGCILHPRHVRIEWVQAHSACEVLDSQVRHTNPVSHDGNVPLLADLVVGRTQDSLTLATGVMLEIAVASPRHVRGVTSVCTILDEIAYMPSAEESANRDVELVMPPSRVWPRPTASCC